MRTDITSGITTQLTTNGAYLGCLVEITPTSGAVLRYTSLDVAFSYNSQTYLPRDIDPPELDWNGGMARAARLTVGDADLSFWVLALNGVLSDALVRLWAVYAGAPTEAAAIYTGRIGSIDPDPSGMTVEFTLNSGSETVSAPRTRVQQIIDRVFLMDAGTILNIAGQRWVIDRPSAPAG